MDNWEKAGYKSYDEYERAAWCSYNDYINNWGSGFLIQVIHEIGISYYMWNTEKDMYFIPEEEAGEHLEGEILDLMFLDYEHVFNGYILTSYQIENFNNKLYVMSEFVANYLNAIECKERLFQIKDKMIEENAQLHYTIEDRDKGLRRLEKTIQELNKEIDTLKETLHKKDEKLEREEKKREAYRLQCSEHVDYINDLEKECEEYKENINDLATQIEDMERVHNDLIGERKQFGEDNERLKKSLSVELARRDTYEEEIKHLKRDKEDLQKKCTDLQRFKDIHENFWTKYQKLIQTSIYEYLMGKIDVGIHPFNVYYKLLQEGREKTCEELFRASYITYEQYAKLKFSLNKQEGKQ